MTTQLSSDVFRNDYDRLKNVSLNPAKHSAKNAYEHCEMVRARVAVLAKLNGCSPQEAQILDDLALLHDIGKISGSANPVKSVELLPKYGTFPEGFVNLVKYHDVNLPWFLAQRKGGSPSDKAWNRMARCLDTHLLCLFMVADRVDCPGGWRTNEALVWFLEQVRNRKLLRRPLILDDGPIPPAVTCELCERSAGVVLVAPVDGDLKALLIQIRAGVFELPKGHIELTETEQEAALRELREETGLMSEVQIAANLPSLAYSFEHHGQVTRKEVLHFLAIPHPLASIAFSPLPKRTKSLRWIRYDELDDIPLVVGDLIPVIREAFAKAQGRAP